MSADLDDRLERGWDGLGVDVDRLPAGSPSELRHRGQRRSRAQRTAAGAVALVGASAVVASVVVARTPDDAPRGLPPAASPSATAPDAAVLQLSKSLLPAAADIESLRAYGPWARYRGGQAKYPPACGDSGSSAAPTGRAAVLYTGPATALWVGLAEYPTTTSAEQAFSSLMAACTDDGYVTRIGTSSLQNGDGYPTLTAGALRGRHAVAVSLVDQRVVWLALSGDFTAAEVGEGGGAENAVLFGQQALIARAR